jgi:D-lactate dehydrogenase
VSKVRIVPRADSDQLGEGVTWSARRQAIFWVDVLAPALNMLELRTGAVSRWPMPERIGWIVERAGREDFLIGLKSGIPTDGLAKRWGFHALHLSDRLLQFISRLFSRHLPKRMLAFRDQFEHHLMLKMPDHGIAEARTYFSNCLKGGVFFECTDDESAKALLHRFAVAGAAVRYRPIHSDSVQDILAIDCALPRNEPNWFESLPDDIDAAIIHELNYGHFFCHVFHQEYVVAKGNDPVELEHRMWALLEARAAQFPAEHNVSHLYKATPALAKFYRSLDPCNQLNPGLGQTSKDSHWGRAVSQEQTV